MAPCIAVLLGAYYRFTLLLYCYSLKNTWCSDFGYNYLSEQARVNVVRAMRARGTNTCFLHILYRSVLNHLLLNEGYNVSSEFFEAVNPSDAAPVLEYLARNNDVVFVPSTDFQATFRPAVARHPNVYFISQDLNYRQPNHMGILLRSWEVRSFSTALNRSLSKFLIKTTHYRDAIWPV